MASFLGLLPLNVSFFTSVVVIVGAWSYLLVIYLFSETISEMELYAAFKIQFSVKEQIIAALFCLIFWGYWDVSVGSVMLVAPVLQTSITETVTDTDMISAPPYLLQL